MHLSQSRDTDNIATAVLPDGEWLAGAELSPSSTHTSHSKSSMEGQQEAILQAVVLADPFEHQSRYGPLIRGGNKAGEGCESANPWVGGAAQ
jgi:hypothetical protein